MKTETVVPELPVPIRALALYTPPFELRGDHVVDRYGVILMDLNTALTRIYRRIGEVDLSVVEDLRNALGKHIAEALTEHWRKERYAFLISQLKDGGYLQ